MARAKLGEILMQQGAINASQLKRALGEQIRFASQKIKLGKILVDLQACTWEQVAQALATQLAVPFADLAEVSPAAAQLLPRELCEKHQAIAFATEAGPPEVVQVAFADPLSISDTDPVRQRLGKRIKAYIAAPDAIQRRLAEAHGEGGAAGESSVDLGDMLFGDGEEAMTIEHDDPGRSRVPVPGGALQVEPLAGVMPLGGDDLFGPSGGVPLREPTPLPRPETPLPEGQLMGESLEPASAPASGPATDAFDDLFGPANGHLGEGHEEHHAAPTSAGRNHLLARSSEPLPDLPKVPIHRFPDRRIKAAPAEVPAAPPPAAPKLVLTSDALFGAAPTSPPVPVPEEVAEEVMMGGVLAEDEPASDPLGDLISAPDSDLSASPPGSEFGTAVEFEPNPEEATEETVEVELDNRIPSAPPVSAPAPVLPATLPPVAVAPVAPAPVSPKPVTLPAPTSPVATQAKAEPPKVELPKPAPKVELPKFELPKLEPKPPTPPSTPAVKPEAPKVEPAKVEAPKVEPKPPTPPSTPAVKHEPAPPRPSTLAPKPELPKTPVPMAKVEPKPEPKPEPVKVAPIEAPPAPEVEDEIGVDFEDEPTLPPSRPSSVTPIMPRPVSAPPVSIQAKPPGVAPLPIDDLIGDAPTLPPTRPVSLPGRLEPKVEAKPEPKPEPVSIGIDFDDEPTLPSLRPASRPPLSKPEPVKVEAPKVEPVKPEPAKVAPPKAEEPKVEASKVDEPLASFADRPLTDEELKVVEAIERLADGAIEESAVKQVKPAQMVAALVRLLIKNGVIQETDFLAELSRK